MVAYLFVVAFDTDAFVRFQAPHTEGEVAACRHDFVVIILQAQNRAFVSNKLMLKARGRPVPNLVFVSNACHVKGCRGKMTRGNEKKR